MGRGKELFRDRVEYPLPKKQGVRDYIFYFVPESDPYGEGARRFFDRFFKRHVRKSVSSLEGLVATLHAEITSNGVSQVREVVIVAHGTPRGLVARVLDGASDTDLPEFRYVTAFSLACLQKDFRDGKLAALARKRDEVVARLQEGSWITIRACRVGSSTDCMYALYSFFGGRANVYAPKEYQFFGSQPLIEGMRVETRLEAHQHLVKQRFLPFDLHTPERKDSVVRFLIDPARFAEPFPAATTRLEDPAPEYVGAIEGLSARRLRPSLRQAFSDHGHALSGRARVRIKEPGAAWVVRDLVEHEGRSHEVEYEIVEEVVPTGGGAGGDASLMASARLVDAPSASDSLPIQLFFYASENDSWRGRLFELAAYAEPPPPEPDGDPDAQPPVDPALKREFDAIVALLNGGRFSDGGVDIKALFRSRGDIDLSGAAVIELVSEKGSGPAKRITWAIRDQERFVLRLEHPPTEDGRTGHTLIVYHGLEGRARLEHELQLMSFLGRDPDTPGTELPAYFDRLSIEELTEVIDHLRSPYRPEHSFYIHHAQQAIARKRDYLEWWLEQYGEKAKKEPLPEQLHAELRHIERDDKRVVAHDFDFNGIWQEVKASHPSPGAFETDLFVEEDLWGKLGRPEDLDDRGAAPELEPDSPGASLEELRRLVPQGLERYFSTDKFVLEPLEDTEEARCQELAAALAAWKDLEGQAPDEIERLLGLETTDSGKTFLDYVHWVYDKYQIAKIGLDLGNISTAQTGIAVRLIERIPAFAPTAMGVPTTFGALLRAAPAITIPLTMWLKFLEGQSQALAAEERRGKLTAIRQWLRALSSWTRSSDFPDTLTIVMNRSEAIARYFDERVIEFNDHFQWIFNGERLQKGFEEGLELMEQVGPDLVDHADEVVAGVLRQFGFTPCEMKVLKEAGLLDLHAIKAEVIRAMVDALLKQVPRVS